MIKYRYRGLQVLGWRWVHGRACIGVVVAYDPKQKLFHGYIGQGAGFDERTDVEKIIDLGDRLSGDRTKPFFREIEKVQKSSESSWKT